MLNYCRKVEDMKFNILKINIYKVGAFSLESWYNQTIELLVEIVVARMSKGKLLYFGQR